MFNEKPTIGGDPEFFIFEKLKSKYKVITADKILPSKAHKSNCGGGQCFFDGVQAEINPHQHSCREMVIDNIRSCLSKVYNKSTKMYPEKDIVFAPLASIPITMKELKGADFECFRFGCSPDSNIYTEDTFEYPDGRELMIRFSGGHIHLGFDDEEHLKFMKKKPNKLMNLIKLIDLIPGLMSVAISPYEDELARRRTYGRAGTYRIQKHGLEYRSLSSFWLVSPPLTSLYTGLVRDCFNIVYAKEDVELLKQIDQEKIRVATDSMNVQKAQAIYKEVIRPFYIEHIVNRGGNSPMESPKVLQLVDEIMDKGYRIYFNPYRMLNYWGIVEPSLVPTDMLSWKFGISKFTDMMEDKKSRKLLERINRG